MTEAPRLEEQARAEIASLLPIRARLAQRSNALRVRLATASATRRDALFERAQRCDHVVRLLDARIRLAAEMIATGEIARDGAEVALHAAPRAAS